MDCDKVYIGETGRNLQKRISEHKRVVRRGDRNNGIAVHARDSQHQVNWEGATIKEVEEHEWRRVLEAIYIMSHPRYNNLDCGLILNDIWHPFVTHYYFLIFLL